MTQKPTLVAKRLTVALVGALAAGMAAGVQAQGTQVQALDTVVVSASGFDQSIKDAPASISVVSRQQLEEKSYVDLADALRDVEGVDVRGATGKTGNLSISIRGMPSEYTLILIDGRRQNAAGDVTPNGFGDTATGFMPPVSAIERIEVIRGPMSTLYGSDAMGGVVNIITRKVAKEWGGSFTMDSRIAQDGDVGNVNKGTVYLNGPIIDDRLGVAIWGSVMRRGASDLHFDDGGTVNKRGLSPSKSRTHDIGAKFTFTPNKDHDIWLQLDQSKQWFDNRECELGNVDMTECSRNRRGELAYVGYTDHMRFNRTQMAVGHTSRLSFGTWESSLMRNETETLGRTIPTDARPAGDPSVGTARTLETTNVVLDTKLVAPIGESHLLSIGGQYWDAKMTDGLVADQYKQKMWALFAEDEWSLTDTLIATLGARYNHHDAFGSHISPRGYLVWNPTQQWTVKGGISRGYKTPGINQLHGGVNSIAGQGTSINVGNPDLQPEVSTSTELGVNYDSLRGWTVGATLFHNKIKDKISGSGGSCAVNWTPSCANGGNIDSNYPLNLDSATTRGLEFNSSIAFNKQWSLRVNYTYTDSEIKKDGKADGPLSDTAKHMANATLRWDIDDKWSAWLQGEYRGKSRRIDGGYDGYTENEKLEYDALGDLKGYTILNLGGQYRVSKNVTLNATIYNLLDKNFLECKTWHNADGDALCGSPYTRSSRSAKGSIPYAGRTFWVSANITF